MDFLLDLRPCTHEQINHHLFAQIITEFLHTDKKIEQIKSIELLHVYEAYSYFFATLSVSTNFT